MCPHEFVRFHDLTVCRRCGAVLLPGGGVMFDRQLPDILRKGCKRAQRKRGLPRFKRVY